MSGLLEYFKALGAIVAAIGICVTFYQIRKNVLWNKLNAAFSMFPNKEFADREQAAAVAASSKGINLYTIRDPFEPSTVDEILSDPLIYGPVKVFMNFFEDYALATKVGVLDADVAYKLMADSLTRNFRVFKPLIDRRRSLIGRAGLWVEWETIARDWSVRLAKDEKIRKERMVGLEERFQAEAVKVNQQYGSDPRNYS